MIHKTIQDIIAEVENYEPSAEETAQENEEREKSAINELLVGIIENEWTPDDVKDHIAHIENWKEINMFDILMSRPGHDSILRYAEGDDSVSCENEILELYHSK